MAAAAEKDVVGEGRGGEGRSRERRVPLCPLSSPSLTQQMVHVAPAIGSRLECHVCIALGGGAGQRSGCIACGIAENAVTIT